MSRPRLGTGPLKLKSPDAWILEVYHLLPRLGPSTITVLMYAFLIAVLSLHDDLSNGRKHIFRVLGLGVPITTPGPIVVLERPNGHHSRDLLLVPDIELLEAPNIPQLRRALDSGVQFPVPQLRNVHPALDVPPLVVD